MGNVEDSGDEKTSVNLLFSKQDPYKCSSCTCFYDMESIKPHSLKCGHTFCRECLLERFKNQRIKCDICK